MISRADRRLFNLPESSEESEGDSSDNEEQSSPEPPTDLPPDKIFNEETEIPIRGNSNFRVYIKKIPFRRQMRYGFEDSQFEYVIIRAK